MEKKSKNFRVSRGFPQLLFVLQCFSLTQYIQDGTSGRAGEMEDKQLTTESCPTFGRDFRSKFEAIPDQLFWARTTIYSEGQEKTNTGTHPHCLNEEAIKVKSTKNKEKDASTRKLACQLWNRVFTKFKKLAPCQTQHIQLQCSCGKARVQKFCICRPGIT